MKIVCIFCEHNLLNSFLAGGKQYFGCKQCGGVFLDPLIRLSLVQERDRYLFHNNSLLNAGYKNYLERFWQGFISFLSPTEFDKKLVSSVLDWGSGPDPAFAKLLDNKGYDVSFYDPFFASKLPKKGTLFDCITGIEVVEHFYEPSRDFMLITSFLADGGYLVVATHILPSDPKDFDSWWYRQDSTHVSFYTELSLRYLGERSGLELVGYAGNHTWVFKKLASTLPALPR